MSTELFETLLNQQPTDRLHTISDVFEGIRHGERPATDAFHGLVQEVVRCERYTPEGGSLDDPSDHALFTAAESATIANDQLRVSRFMRAIADAQRLNIKTIVEAGTGSSGVLAIAAALSYPNAEVITYEANPYAAHCARVVLGLCGIDDRVSVITGDALLTTLPQSQLGITETFYTAGMNEPGVALAYKLAEAAEVVVPTEMRVLARDTATNDAAWQRLTTLRFERGQQPADTIQGYVRGTGTGVREVYVLAELYDNHGRVILDRHDDSSITVPEYVGRMTVRSVGQRIHISYQPGMLTNQAGDVVPNSNQ